MIYLQKGVIGPWMANQLHMVWTPENSSTIGWLNDDGQIKAAVWYEDFNSQSVTCHIVIKGWIGRRFLKTIFDYPFNQLSVKWIICPILSGNQKSIRLVEKMGFVKDVVLKDVSPGEDLIFYRMNRDNCRFLGDRYGKII